MARIKAGSLFETTGTFESAAVKGKEVVLKFNVRYNGIPITAEVFLNGSEAQAVADKCAKGAINVGPA